MAPLATSAEYNLGPVIAKPTLTKTLDFSDMGYNGWVAVIKLNPKSVEYDKLWSQDTDIEWEGIGSIVLDWNFGDEDGNKLPLPGASKRADCDVPLAVLRRIMDEFHQSFRQTLELPKRLDESSEATSSTNNGQINSA